MPIDWKLKVEGYTESLQLISRLSWTAKNPSCIFSTHNHPHGLQFLLVPYDCTLKPHFIKVGDRNIVRFDHLGFTRAIYHVLDTSAKLLMYALPNYDTDTKASGCVIKNVVRSDCSEPHGSVFSSFGEGTGRLPIIFKPGKVVVLDYGQYP